MKRRNTLIDLEQLDFLMSCHFLNVFYHHYIQSEHWVGVSWEWSKSSQLFEPHSVFVLISIYSAKFWDFVFTIPRNGSSHNIGKGRSTYKPSSLLGQPWEM